jgi:short-subunit dehydrogenase
MIQATLEDSEDIEAARRNYEMAQRMGVTPEHVAARIINAIRKRSMRIRIGKETFILEYLKRLFPVAMHRLVARAAL